MSLSAGSLVLDAEALYRELLRGVRSLMGPNTQLAGVASGGAWLLLGGFLAGLGLGMTSKHAKTEQTPPAA